MIWPCKDTAVSIRRDVHCHALSRSARVSEQGTRWSCVLLNAVYPHFPLCWRQSNKPGVIPACPSTCVFHTISDSLPICHTHLPRSLTVHTDQKMKTTPQQRGFSGSPFPSFDSTCLRHLGKSLGCRKNVEHHPIQQHCVRRPQFWICFWTEFKVFFRLRLWHPDRSYGYHYRKTERCRTSFNRTQGLLY